MQIELQAADVRKILEVLCSQTGNPISHYNGLKWVKTETSLDEITVDERFFGNVSITSQIDRLLSLKASIQRVGLREPLIVLYFNRLLADGYDRYQILRNLGFNKVPVYHGFYPGTHRIYDLNQNAFRETHLS